MSALRKAAAEVYGLFVEDRVFALEIALWLALSGALAHLHAGSPQTRALALFAGLALILVASVARNARVR